MYKHPIAILLTLMLLGIPAASSHTMAACPVFAPPAVVGQLKDPRWSGISGLAASHRNPGVWWIHNDGGVGRSQAGTFYAINNSGLLLGAWQLSGVSQLELHGHGIVDTEDVAVGPGPDGDSYLYLGDIGGNRYEDGGRSSVRVFRIAEPLVDGQNDGQVPVRTSTYTTLMFDYPPGLRYDAESLMIDPDGTLYIVTKNGATATSVIYTAKGPYTDQAPMPLTPIATLHFKTDELPGDGAATSGDISVRGDEALIRTYDHIFLWSRAPNASWATTFAATQPCTLPAEKPELYEAVAFDRDGIDVYDTYESIHSPPDLQRFTRKTSIPRLYLPLLSRSVKK